MTTTIPPDKRFGIIFAGSMDELKAAVAERLGSRPVSKCAVNGYGSIHCDIWGTKAQLDKWFAEDHRLRFFLGKG